MKLFLTSQVYHVAHSIGPKVADEVKKKSVFIITPIRNKHHTDEELEWHYKNKKYMEDNGFVFDVYDIAGKSEHDLKQDLDTYELMYVEGGNPFYLLQEAQKNNFGKFVTNRINQGMIYIGTSGGSSILGPDISPLDRPGKSANFTLKNTQGFGLVNFVVMPHWGNEEKREANLKYKIPNSYHEKWPYILLADNQYVEVEGDWFNIVDVTKEQL